jgi:hypothetical protein
LGSSNIARLERVPLREVWRHEAYDFTQWLQDNIDILNETLDLTLVNVSREQASGSFSIDLVAEDESGGTVIVENQLDRSNHDHLGKLLTYLTGLSAKAAIWIVSDPRPEHVAAIAWLNESTAAAFYMVKVEAVRIGDSPAAPLFTLIVGPSEESREVGNTKREISESYSIRKRWWKQLIERSALISRLHAHVTPPEASWISVSSGIRGLGYMYVVTESTCSVELYIDRGKDSDLENKAIFDHLLLRRESIEQAFGASLSWERLEVKRACRIRSIRTEGGYRSPEDDWPALQDSAIAAMNRLVQALGPHLKTVPRLKQSIEEQVLSSTLDGADNGK